MWQFVASDQSKLWFTMLKACRPWSFPNSLLPVLIISTVVPSHLSISLMKLNCIALSLLCVHCGSNLANTYYDYVNDIDTRRTSSYDTIDTHPDPILVYNMLSSREVKAMAILAYAIGISVTCAMILLDTHYVTFHELIHSAVPPTTLLLYLIGCFLGYYYTANPFSFKYQGLGDIVVLLCFGPFLTQYIALLVLHSVPLILYFYTLPLTFMTVAILHANNTRDIYTDRQAGIITIAGHLGKERSFHLYALLAVLSYLGFFNIAVFHQRYACLITWLTIPLAWRLIQAFHREKYANVVKDTARLHLIVGLLYYVGLIISKK